MFPKLAKSLPVCYNIVSNLYMAKKLVVNLLTFVYIFVLFLGVPTFILAEETPTPTQTPTQTPSPTGPTLTPQAPTSTSAPAAPTRTPTPKRSPTPKSSPTVTPTSSPTVTPSLTPTPTKAPGIFQKTGGPLGLGLVILGLVLLGVTGYLYKKNKVTSV